MAYRLVFSYINGEKSVLTADLSEEQVEMIAESIANAPYDKKLLLKLGTKKQDIFVIDSRNMLFFCSSVADKE